MKPKPQPRRSATSLFSDRVGRAIRLLRTEQDLERKELAAAAGISYSYLAEIENGVKAPSSKTLLAISEALGMRPQQILVAADSLRTRRQGQTRYSLQDEVAMSFRQAWTTPRTEHSQLPSDARHEAAEELADLLDRMDDDDVQILLEMARRLSRGHRD